MRRTLWPINYASVGAAVGVQTAGERASSAESVILGTM